VKKHLRTTGSKLAYWCGYLSQKRILIGNRKLVLKVIQKNPGSSLWRIKRKLREIHKDWRPNIFTIIKHVLALHSANLVVIKPRYNVSELKKIIKRYRDLKRKRRQNLSKLEAEEKEIMNFAKKLSFKTRCYPVELEKLVKEILCLKYKPEHEILQSLRLFLNYLKEQGLLGSQQALIKKLGELESEIKPPNLRKFEKTLYLLCRNNFIKITVPSPVVTKPKSKLQGKRWKKVRQVISEELKERSPKSIGEIVLYYTYTSRSNSLRARRRNDVKDLLTISIIPRKLDKLAKLFRVR